MSADVIASLHNPRVRDARKLLRRSVRERERAFIAEGPVVVREAIDAAAPIREIFVRDDPAFSELLVSAERASIPVHLVDHAVIAALTDSTTPQGIVAVVDHVDRELDELPAQASLAVVLVDVRDPGNAGTLIRSAVAAAADAVVFAADCVDAYNPKTVRASAGLLFRCRIVRDVMLEPAAASLREAGFKLLAADAGAERAIDAVDLTEPVAFVLGNEARGIDPEWESWVDEVAAIRMPGPAESLNVGIAGSILLFEAVRQRRARGA